MISAQDAVLIVVGIIATFMGYSVFRSMMPLWGFILGGWLTFILLPTILGPARAGDLLIQLVAVIVGGAIGALLAIPLYFVIIFLSGAALGMLIGVLAGALVDVGGPSSVQAVRTFMSMSFPPMPQSATQWVLMLIFGLIMGGVGIAFQKFMICASSSFVGAAALVTGLGGSIATFTATDMSKAAVMMVGFLILGMVGLFVQFRMMDEV